MMVQGNPLLHIAIKTFSAVQNGDIIFGLPRRWPWVNTIVIIFDMKLMNIMLMKLIQGKGALQKVANDTPRKFTPP